MSSLLSTLQALPDGARADVERALLPVARDAALGALSPDIAHDVGNALFGLVGLVELSLDGTPLDPERKTLITNAQEDVKAAFGPLLAFARGATDAAPGDLVAATRAALELYRHGKHKLRDVTEHFTEDRAPVPCPRGLLVQAVVHMLLATDETQRALSIDVAGRALAVAPAGEESLNSVAAARIAVDHGGVLERDGGALLLRFAERP